VAREKSVRNASLEDFERLRDEYGHLEEVAFGLVAGFEWVRQTGIPQDTKVEDRLAFLSWFLEREYQELSHEIYSAVVTQIIDLFERGAITRSKIQRCWHWEDKLVSFLASHEPLEGMRGRVNSYLRNVARNWLYVVPKLYPQLDGKNHLENVVRNLLRYKDFEEVKELFVDPKVYAAIPALFEAVVKQVGEGDAYWLKDLVLWGWRDMADSYIAAAFRLVGDDTRTLRLLLDLSQAHIDEHGRHYPTEELQQV